MNAGGTMRVTCLGDSICYGYGVWPDKAWVSLLAATLKQHCPECSVCNAGVNGETAGEGLFRLPSLLKPAPDLVYVQFGLNDAGQHVPVEQYLGNMREIVYQALGSGVQSLIVSTNHVVCVTEEQQLYGGRDFRECVRRYNTCLRDALAMPPERLKLVDMEALFEKAGDEEQARLLQYDGVHLSERGNIFYARWLEPVFRQCLPF